MKINSVATGASEQGISKMKDRNTGEPFFKNFDHWWGSEAVEPTTVVRLLCMKSEVSSLQRLQKSSIVNFERAILNSNSSTLRISAESIVRFLFFQNSGIYVTLISILPIRPFYRKSIQLFFIVTTILSSFKEIESKLLREPCPKGIFHIE